MDLSSIAASSDRTRSRPCSLIFKSCSRLNEIAPPPVVAKYASTLDPDRTIARDVAIAADPHWCSLTSQPRMVRLATASCLPIQRLSSRRPHSSLRISGPWFGVRLGSLSPARRKHPYAREGVLYFSRPVKSADSDEGNRVFRSDVDKDQSSAKLAVSW